MAEIGNQMLQLAMGATQAAAAGEADCFPAFRVALAQIGRTDKALNQPNGDARAGDDRCR